MNVTLHHQLLFQSIRANFNAARHITTHKMIFQPFREFFQLLTKLLSCSVFAQQCNNLVQCETGQKHLVAAFATIQTPWTVVRQQQRFAVGLSVLGIPAEGMCYSLLHVVGGKASLAE